ncbi:MAG: methyltransferase family protein [Promethearchaeota archaeon]
MKSENGCGIGAEYPHSHLLQILFIIIFIFSWIIDGLFFKLSVKYGIFIIDFFRITSFTIILILAFWFIKQSGKVISEEVIENSKLIKEGIFKRTRHPMYLGILLIYLAFVFLTISFVCLISWIFIAIIMNKMASYEEKDLENIFGEEYLEYKKSVPKWIPKFKEKNKIKNKIFLLLINI